MPSATWPWKTSGFYEFHLSSFLTVFRPHLRSVEMRHDVVTPAYVIRKTLDNFLYAMSSQQVTASAIIPRLAQVPFPTSSPSGWLPLYTMVTFRPDVSYSTARRKVERQNRILQSAGWLGAASAIGFLAVTCVAILRRAEQRT